MLVIQRPQVEALSDADGDRQLFAISPLEPGFGHTLGNSLRRTLLSSIPGAAITQVRFDDALHEFDTIEGITEDVTDIILNLKDLVLQVYADEPVTLRLDDALHEFGTIKGVKEDVTDIILNLKDLVLTCTSDEDVPLRLDVRGPKEVTARDIQTTSDVEILNLDLPIASVNASGRLALDLTVEQGRGYASADKTKRAGAPSGEIPVDAIFSPVRRVAFEIEPTRVEQATNYDKLTLEIETDGSITPREALASAGATLRNLVALVGDLSAEQEGLELGEVSPVTATSPDLELPIEELDLSERPRNCLKRARVDSIGQLVQKTEDDLLAITNFGQKSLDEVIQKLDERGLSLRMKD